MIIWMKILYTSVTQGRACWLLWPIGRLQSPPLTNQKAVFSAQQVSRYSVGNKYWPLLRRWHTHCRGRPAECPPCSQPLCLLSFLLRSPGCRDLLLPGAVTPSQDTSRLNKEKYFSKLTPSEFATVYWQSYVIWIASYHSLWQSSDDTLSLNVRFEVIVEKKTRRLLGQGNCETVTHICMLLFIG